MGTATHTTSPGIMPRLRDETAALHHETENKPLQRAMASGRLSREMYVAYLGQLLHVHRALESELSNQQTRPNAHRALSIVYRPQLDKTRHLSDDLAYFGVDAQAIDMLPATRHVANSFRALGTQMPVALLGSLYVLEGSTNGGRFIARGVIRAYGLSDRKGYAYLDPYSDEQPVIWQKFKADMQSVGFDEQEEAALVAAAGEMFKGIGDISDAVWAANAGHPAA